MKSFLLALCTLLICVLQASHAFVSPLGHPVRGTPASAATLVAHSVPLNQVDEMCIENVAEFCLEDALACDVEEFEALVNQLQEQRTYHASQVQLLDELLEKLSGRTETFHDAAVNNSSLTP